MDKSKINTGLLVIITGLLVINAIGVYSKPSIAEIDARIQHWSQHYGQHFANVNSNPSMAEIDARIQYWGQHYGQHFANK